MVSRHDDPQVYQDAARFRARLLRADAAALRSLALAMRDIIRDLDESIVAVADRIAAQSARGAVSPGAVVELAEYQRLREQADRALRRYTVAATDRIAREQEVAALRAIREARQLAESALPRGLTIARLSELGLSWASLNPDAVEVLVGRLADGSTLRNYLQPLIVQGTIDDVTRKLTVGLHQNPRITARELRRSFAGGAAQAMSVARTETLRAYRDASRMTWRENPGVVRAYRRMAALDDRTCAACWLLDGTLYPTDRDLEEHTRGRCFMVPETVSWAELGMTGPERSVPTPGRERFVRLPAERQRQIIGNESLFQAFRSGEVQLGDLIRAHHSPAFGTSWSTSSAKYARLFPGRQLPALDRTAGSAGGRVPVSQ